MKNILLIYINDWKNIFKVPTVVLLIAALMVLPSAYAWINIKSMWDPYSNTSGIKVAVSNQDTGADFNGKEINAGKEIVDKLKSNHKLGWVFVPYKQAEQGVKRGKYYAYILIPKDFSEKLTSIIEANPEKPSIDFGVNEKINAVAPKIASSGASSVTAQISQVFIKTVSKAIFTVFYKAGVELEKDLPSILQVENQLFELEKALPEIHAMGAKAIELEGKLPELHEKAQKVIQLEERIPEIHKAGESILKVEAALPAIRETGDRIIALQDKIADVQRISVIMTEVVSNLNEIDTNVMQAMESVQETNQIDTSENQQQLTQLHNELVTMQASMDEIGSSLQQKVDKVTAKVNSSADFIREDFPAIEQKLHKAGDFVRNDLPGLEKDIHHAANLMRTKLPELERAIHKAADLARNDLPGFEEKVRRAADKIRKFKSSVNIHDLIEFLKHDPEKESSFLANPILLTTKRIFPIPNYGSAMAPFYTMLAIWVGATLLIASLRVDVENPNDTYRGYQLYFGRLLTFLTVGIFQAAIVSLGDLFILHTYVVNKLWFVLLCILISMVFIVITYTLCSVLGNIGKGLAIIFLVLQISSSGATFPVSTTSPFFQAIYPFMPFSYAVSMLRETVGGMMKDIVIKDVLSLLLFVAASFLLALVFKRPLERRIQQTAAKARTTKIIP